MVRGNYNKTSSPCPSYHVEDELSYQADESPTVLPILTIELVQGLADTPILEVPDDDPIEPVDDDSIEPADDDTDEDIDFSNEVDEQNDNSDEQHPD